MVNPIPAAIRRTWEHCNTRGTIILSLSLQICLIFLAPFRKRTANMFIMLFIWLSYLLADAAANFAIGLISNSQSTYSGSTISPENSDLLAFWAPFLLVHLGGPDTITSYALADNELWVRHLLQLVIQVFATGYVFIQTLPNNKLMVPTILLFVAGVMKYLERTCSLYLASVDGFRDSILKLKAPDPGPNYAKLMEVFGGMEEANLPTQIVTITESADNKIRPTVGFSEATEQHSLEDDQVVRQAYRFFQIFKKLMVDLTFSFKERDDSRSFFSNISPEGAFKVIEVELNFLYEALFTKGEVVHSSWGKFFRFIASCSILAAAGVFRFHVKKHGRFDEVDIGITYALLLGAIVLDTIAFFRAIFSDWTTVAYGHSKQEGPVAIFKQRLLDNMRARIFRCRRWSGSVSGYNLITYSLKIRPDDSGRTAKVINCLHIDKVILGINGYAAKVIKFLHIDKAISKINECIGRLIKFLHIDKAISKINECIGRLIKFLPIEGATKPMQKAFNSVYTNVEDKLRGFLDEIFYVSKSKADKLTNSLWTSIFKELQKKSESADDPETGKQMYGARGDWVLQYDTSLDVNGGSLMPYLLEVDYDESLLLWHIATDLLYNIENSSGENDNLEQSKELEDLKNLIRFSQITCCIL